MRNRNMDQQRRLAAIHAQVMASLRQDIANRQVATVMSLPRLGKNAEALKKANYQLNEVE